MPNTAITTTQTATIPTPNDHVHLHLTIHAATTVPSKNQHKVTTTHNTIHHEPIPKGRLIGGTARAL